jgi:threonine/homoserine/homoserine lactone efflux protein
LAYPEEPDERLDPSFFLRGLIVGFSIAAPVGPIGLLCIQRTLTKGRTSGLMSGLGAATADGVYGGVAGFGVAFVSSFLVAQQMWLRLSGGTFLIYLGARIWFKNPGDVSQAARNGGLASDYASTFALTLTNPLTIISFAAIFAGIGLGSSEGDYATAAILTFGVFAGSSLWWLLLSSTVNLFRRSSNSSTLKWVNRFSGAIIVTLGLVAVLSLMI